jgi:hypothetical protein
VTEMAVESPPAEPTPVDHEGLLRELIGHIRDIPLPGRNKHVTDLLAWVASRGL